MSRENFEALRGIYAEWARGNFEAGAELYASDAISSWEVPEGRTVSHGVQETVSDFRVFLQQWNHFRVEAEEFVELDESNILVVSRLHGRGKQSGAELEARSFHVWVFRGGQDPRIASVI